MEWAGACGDFGTLIPFIAGYIGVLKLDPFGILCSFGLAMLACGVYYKTPVPVQPMKAVAAIALTQAAFITPQAVYAAGLVTGLLWLCLGLSGMAGRIAALVPRPVVTGISLGLGMSLMLTGLKMMTSHWLIAAVGLFGTLLLLSRRRVPAMFLLLLFGLVCGLFLNQGLLPQLLAGSIAVSIPRFALVELGWSDLVSGALLLALPQLPLTLGNAVLAIREENNRLFPERPVSDRQLATSTGVMNLAGAAIGGVPMCHGAGGMAAHVTFGARSGGALIILGSFLLLLAVFFSGSIHLLFQVFPAAILGVLLFISGGQLVRGSWRFDQGRMAVLVSLLTAVIAIWHVALAFLVGIGVYHLIRRSRSNGVAQQKKG